MNKYLLIASFILSSVLYGSQTMAAVAIAPVVPVVDSSGTPAFAACKPKTVTSTAGVVTPTLDQPVMHFDKIVFAVTGKLTAATGTEQPKLDRIPLNTELDIKVVDLPNTVADLRAKVLNFLGASTIPTPNYNPRSLIKIFSVTYASVVCPK